MPPPLSRMSLSAHAPPPSAAVLHRHVHSHSASYDADMSDEPAPGYYHAPYDRPIGAVATSDDNFSDPTHAHAHNILQPHRYHHSRSQSCSHQHGHHRAVHGQASLTHSTVVLVPRGSGPETRYLSSEALHPYVRSPHSWLFLFSRHLSIMLLDLFTHAKRSRLALMVLMCNGVLTTGVPIGHDIYLTHRCVLSYIPFPEFGCQDIIYVDSSVACYRSNTNRTGRRPKCAMTVEPSCLCTKFLLSLHSRLVSVFILPTASHLTHPSCISTPIYQRTVRFSRLLPKKL
jgi:hypothetical protein